MANNPKVNAQTYKELAAHGDASSTGVLYPPSFNVLEKAANYTVKANDPGGTLFVAKTGAVTFTLPPPAAALLGKAFYFLNGVNADMTVATATADTAITTNDVAADSVAASTSSKKIGALIMAVCVSIDAGSTYQWAVVGLSGGDGITYTVATA